MTADPFEAADVPALRRDLLTWLTDGRGMNFHTTMSHQAGTMLGRPELDGDPATMRAYAEMVVEQEIRTLREAELYYVTPEMTAIVAEAAADMPAFPPDASDFPTPAGFIVYGGPLVTYERPGAAAPLVVQGRTVADQSRDNISVTSCTWGPYNAGGGWKNGGVWMSFYRARSEWLAAVVDDHLMKHVLADVTRLIPDNEYGIKFEDDPQRRAMLEQELIGRDTAAYTSYWAKHLLATLLLMRQPIVYQRTEPVRRGLRRQLERSGYPAGDIRIVDARPHRYVGTPGAADEPGEPTTDAPQDPSRRLTVRFPVRGFWRNQWYPSRGAHRPKWIDPHWRGPDDAPIVHPERVRVLRDHPEPEPARAASHGAEDLS